MMERNITYHVSADRTDRTLFILEKLGIGNVIKEEKRFDENGRGSWECLTDTGVLLVKSLDNTIIVTLYIPNLSKVNALYKGNTPSWVFKMVKKNQQYAKMQNKVKG